MGTWVNIWWFQILWMRSRDVVILSHGTTVFTTDSRVEVNKTKRSLEAAAVSDQATRTAAAFIKYNLIRESIYILFQIKVNKAKYLTYLYTLSYFLFDGIAWISVRQSVTGAKTCHFYMFWHRHSHRPDRQLLVNWDQTNIIRLKIGYIQIIKTLTVSQHQAK